MKPKLLKRSSITRQSTALTLPAESVAQANGSTQARRVSPSGAVSASIADGLRQQSEAAHNAQVVSRYRRAFGKFSEEEMLVLDGVISRPTGKH